MKKQIKSSWLSRMIMVMVILLVVSCTKNFDETNRDSNTIATIGSSELPFLFAKAENIAVPNRDYYEISQHLFADHYAQYYACTATYYPMDRNVIRMDWIWSAFDPVYTEMVPQLQTIFAATDPSSPEHALANIVWVYGFHHVTDYWGPIPYFKAGIPGNTVPYDPQDQIYDDFFKRLDSAVAVLKNADASPYGSYDLIYGGNTEKWLRLANTLKLRLAIRISAVDPARAKAEGESAVADGVFETSPDDDALIKKSLKGKDYNALSNMTSWDEFRMSAAMESVLVGYQDPRLPVYFLPAGANQNNPAGTGHYEGLRNGLTPTQLLDPANKAGNLSNPGPRWSSTAYGGTAGWLETPQNVMCAAEAYFLRAEGAMLGWSMGGTVKDFYEGGIKTSMYQWGITDATAIDGYINSSNTPIAPNDYLNSPPVSNAPVKFSADPAVQKVQIGIQKWLALYPDGYEAWADYRRGRAFVRYPVANSDNQDITNTTSEWIRRIPFLQSETETNKTAVDAALPLLGGGPDKVTTALWWDKNN